MVEVTHMVQLVSIPRCPCSVARVERGFDQRAIDAFLDISAIPTRLRRIFRYIGSSLFNSLEFRADQERSYKPTIGHEYITKRAIFCEPICVHWKIVSSDMRAINAL